MSLSGLARIARIGVPIAVAATATLTTPSPGSAQTGGDPPGTIAFEEHRLANGLHVILAPDDAATAVSVNVWYHVGSRNERRGRSGFAHLFEHLMFQGSANVAAGEHFQFVERAGGNLNASITEDRTNYYQTVPPERMNLALWLEADRMRSLDITEEALAREVEVVKEERRLRIDNAPYGSSQLAAFYYAAYEPESCFAYAHSPIGSMEDLDAAELADVRAFFDLYYAPNNATLVVAGAFDRDVALELIDEYFAAIPRGNEPPEIVCDRPFDHLPVHQTVHDPNAQLPALWISYASVPTDHADAAALNLLADILGDGESSRLHRRLVRDEQAAVQTAAMHGARLDPGLFHFIAIANMGVDAERLLELLDEEVRRIVDDGVTDAELERARNRARAGIVLSRQSAMGRAESLQSANRFHGTPEAANTVVTRLERVTPEDVHRVARQYLDANRRAVIVTMPGTGNEEEDR